MMVMTAKVDKKKIAIIAAIVAGLVLAMILLFSGGGATQTVANTVSDNDGRVAFLKEMGWEVNATPVQSGQVRVPESQSKVFDRYNALQKSQGYDLSQYAGQTVMRYVYQISNYPGATDPVYATVLVHKNQIIGGDVTNTAAKGVIQGLQKPVENKTPSATAAPNTDS
jgi:hypothetical protein